MDPVIAQFMKIEGGWEEYEMLVEGLHTVNGGKKKISRFERSGRIDRIDRTDKAIKFDKSDAEGDFDINSNNAITGTNTIAIAGTAADINSVSPDADTMPADDATYDIAASEGQKENDVPEDGFLGTTIDWSSIV